MKRIQSEQPTSNPEPSVVIVGALQSGRAAAWFGGADAPQAAAAAAECGFQVLSLASDEQKRLATKLPRGRLQKDGRPHVPRVSASANDSLAQLQQMASKPADSPAMTALPDPENAAKAEAQAAPEPCRSSRLPTTVGVVAPAPKIPHDFDEIGPGSLVLARDDREEAWYEAIVVLAQSDHFWLRWRDYPRERQVERRRDQLALLYPKAA